MQKIKLGIASLIFSLLTVVGFSAAPAFAQLPASDPATSSSTSTAAAPATTPSTTTTKADACDALKQLDSSRTCDSGDTGVNNLVKAVVTILSIVVGIAAVIMVIISALKYVTASGDPSNVSSAKNTLLYAMIGLFIAALAQALVHLVLNNTK